MQEHGTKYEILKWVSDMDMQICPVGHCLSSRGSNERSKTMTRAQICLYVHYIEWYMLSFFVTRIYGVRFDFYQFVLGNVRPNRVIRFLTPLCE